MISRAPYLLSLLTLPLLAGMIIFILVRRPREPVTWGFAGVMAGLIVFYLGDLVLYRPGLSVLAGLIWQFVSNSGANLTILSAVLLNILLRERRLALWEWAVTAYIVARMIVVDFVWLPTYLRVDLPRACQPIAQGLPRLVCVPEGQLAIATGAVTSALIGILYASTALKAEEPRRHILRRYIVWIVLLIVGGSLILHTLTLLDQPQFGVFPSQPMVLLASVIGLRLFLALEEQATGIRVSNAGRGVLVWLAALIVAIALDFNWDWFGFPIWTLIVFAVGIAGAGAFLINALLQRSAVGLAHESAVSSAPDTAAPAQPAAVSTQPAAVSTQPFALRIWLFGPMRVERDNQLLPNSTEVWRSAKTRSLLAYLALRGARGATQMEIVDALWPVNESLSGQYLSKAEHDSLTAFRSYLSTLRHVLEPDGPRGSDRFVELVDGCYRLRQNNDLWVDVWEFEVLAAQAEKHRLAGQVAESTACWEAALALYSPEGLLPTERYLPTGFVEAHRVRLRQRVLLGLRRLVKYYTEHGPTERATELRQLMARVESEDGEL